jgi:regulation of enolase protein 1 (concanavalin A-like superfamily)
MIRESLASGAKYTLVGVSTVSRYRLQYRTSTGASPTTSAGGGAMAPNVWLRLVRSGSSISIYTSTDGGNWESVSSIPITMATNIYLGLAVASGTTTTLNTAAFGNVNVVP